MNKYFLLFLLFFFGIKFAFPQNELGLSTITNYHPTDYLAYSQNWYVNQDERGVMYFANGDGMLEFDGSYWNLIKLADEASTATAIYIDTTASLIFIGAKSDFGFVYVDSKGLWKYQSLKILVKEKIRNFGFITEILNYKDKIIFSSNFEHFIYDIKSKTIDYQKYDSYGREYILNGRLYRMDIDNGMYCFIDGEMQLIQEGEQLKSHLVRSVLLTAEGNYLFFTRRNGILSVNGKQLHDNNVLEIQGFSTEIDSFLVQAQINHAIALKNSFIAIATMREGTVVIDSKGNLKQSFDINSGLLNSTHNYLFQDKNGSLWIAMDNGIAKVDINSPITYWNENYGLKGAVMTIARFKNEIYVGTWQGLYKMDNKSSKTSVQKRTQLLNTFSPIQDVKTQCWNLNVIACQQQEFLFISSSLGLYCISENKPVLIDGENRYYTVYQSVKDSSIIYGANDKGLSILKISEASVEFVKQLEEINHAVISIREDDNGLWLGTEYNGLRRIVFKENAKPLIKSYSENEGLPAAEYTYVYNIKDQIVFLTKTGAFVYLPYYDKIYAVNQYFPWLDFSQFYVNIVSATQNANIWMQISAKEKTRRIILQLSDLNKHHIHYLINPYRLIPLMEVLSFYPEKNNVVWFSGDDGLYRYDLKQMNQLNIIEFSALIRRVYATDSRLVFNGNRSSNHVIPSIDYKNNSIVFEFSSTNYLSGNKNLFQFYLEGYEKNWSEWTYDKRKEYTNLPPGKYMFRIRTKDVFGHISDENNFIFYIEYPWYMTAWAFISYFAFLLLIIFLVARISNWRLLRTKRKLEEVVLQRTAKILAQKKEIEQEKEKSDKLLLNILPAEIAEELKNKGFAETRYYEDATVIFADFKSFTSIAEKLQPKQLIKILDGFFAYFDDVCQKYRLEKIKTIGDAYMCVGGIPKPNTTHAIDAVLAALEIQDYMQKNLSFESEIWQLRIGIHSGELIAGVVGKSKFAYDVWGDTVNIASRMEENSEENRINISASTYQQVKEFFDLSFRGELPVKNKNNLAMYYVDSVKKEFLSGDTNQLNEDFKSKYNRNKNIQFYAAKEYILKRLAKELDKDLSYHDIKHTFNVYKAVIFYIQNEDVSSHQAILLKTAALYHDAGFLFSYENNEKEAIRLVEEVLPQFNYTKEDIETICSLILKTNIALEPETNLQQILCDADLDYLGTDNYFNRAEKLKDEWEKRGKSMSWEEWYQLQLDFLDQHKYYTKTAISHKQPTKEHNINIIKEKMQIRGSNL
jgi:class 3 adenylate cyclase/ligand-binding sensor domain-containing protein